MNEYELRKLFPNASESFIRDNLTGVCSPEPKPDQRKALVSVQEGQERSGVCFEIRFTVFARRACDWDNIWTKGLQDCLRHAGIIHDDCWDVLASGTIETIKVKTKAEERTEIRIYESPKVDA